MQIYTCNSRQFLVYNIDFHHVSNKVPYLRHRSPVIFPVLRLLKCQVNIKCLGKMAKQQAICLICIYGVCICSMTFTIINVLICLPQTLLQYLGFLFHMKFVVFHCFNFICNCSQLRAARCVDKSGAWNHTSTTPSSCTIPSCAWPTSLTALSDAHGGDRGREDYKKIGAVVGPIWSKRLSVTMMIVGWW